MDWPLEFLAKVSRHGDRQWCAGRDAKTKLGQRRHVVHFGKRLVKKWHAWKHRRVRAGKVGQECARRSVAAEDQWHPAGDEWGEQIAESIRVRNRNRTEVQIGIRNSHCVANLVAIGQQLRAAKAD